MADTYRIAAYAQRTLLYEASLTPKPGLVDRANSGAHQDMDFWTFLDSSVALGLFFPRYLEAGLAHTGSLPALFDKLRGLGQEAECAMFAATKGINTHKGANFSFALLLGAIGYWQQRPAATLPLSPADTDQILTLVQEMTADLLRLDFQNLDKKKNLSYGERLYVDYGITGIRGEAAAGYPALKDLLGYFRRQQADTADQETTLLRGLLSLMATVEDGNLIHRGGVSAWQEVKTSSQQLLEANLTDVQLPRALEAFDQQLTQKHLSPGGAADLLALGIFLGFLEGLFE